MRKKSIKSFAIMMTVLLAATAIAGCGNGNGSNESTQEATESEQVATTSDAALQKEEDHESEQLTGAVSFPLEETVELTIATPYYGSEAPKTDLLVWQELEERTNIKINWELIPNTEYADNMKIRINSGKNEADIFVVPNGMTLGELVNSNRIIPLDDHLQDNGEYLQKVYEEYPAVKQLTSVDGHVYAVNKVNESAFVTPYAFYIRQDWLDRLGLEVPETIEDWETVLTAFRDEDADGDGDPNNEIPFSAAGHAWYPTFWGYAWGLHLFYSDGWYPDEQGLMQYEFVSEHGKEFFIWLNKMYSEGLLDPEFLVSGDENALRERIIAGNIGSFTGYINAISSYENEMQEAGIEDAKFTAVIPPEGPYGQTTEVQGLMDTNGYVISGDCSHPEVAVALLNYLYGGDGNELLNYGVEGITFQKDEDGNYEFTQDVKEQATESTLDSVLRSYGVTSGLVPFYRTLEASRDTLQTLSEEEQERRTAFSEMMLPYITPSLMLPPVTVEESQVIERFSADLTTYMWDNVGKFITGASDIDSEWDQYVKQLNELGLEEVLKVKQAQYDRLEK